jgi:molybdopterin converting factor small subunit
VFFIIEITVKYTFGYNILLGKNEEKIYLPEDSTLKDVWHWLSINYPQIFESKDTSSQFLPPLLVLNGARVTDDTVLSQGDCVTVIGPLEGG